MERKHSEQAPMSIGWYINEIKRLEAEVASLKTQVEWKAIVASELCSLRARHSALVEKYNELLDV